MVSRDLAVLAILVVLTALIIAVVSVVSDEGSEAPPSEDTLESRMSGPPDSVAPEESLATTRTQRPSPADPSASTDPFEENKRRSASARVFLRLHSALSKEPIANSMVKINRTALKTNAHGDVSSEYQRSLPIKVKGFSYTRLYPPLNGTDRDRPIRMFLWPAGTLRGTILDADQAPAKEVPVRALVTRRHATSGLNYFPSPNKLQGKFSYTCKTDQEGRFSIEDLPSKLPFKICARVLRTHGHWFAESQVLAPHEIREIVFILPRFYEIEGTVVDQYSQPVCAAVWRSGLRRSRQNTDESGHFLFRGLASGTYRLEVEPFTGDDHTQGDCAQALKIVRITESERKVKKMITVHRGIFITGFVVGPGGEPVPGVEISSSPAIEGYDGNLGVDTASRRDGSFRLGPLSPGSHFIRASGKGKYADLDPIRVTSGSKEVYLRLRVGGILKGTVACAQSAKPVTCQIRAMKRGAKTFEVSFSDPSSGVFVFKGLPPGTYDLYLEDPEQVGGLRGVRIGDGEAKTGIALRAYVGATVTVIVRCWKKPSPPSKPDLKVSVVHRGNTFHSEMVTSPETKIKIPADRSVVVLENVRTKKKWERPVSVAPGENVKVVIVP